MSEERKSRITTACDYCRSKRAKCDGKSPICTNCSRNEIKCTYFKKSKKRGLPTGYIGSLETQISAFQALLGHLITSKMDGGPGLLRTIQQVLQSPQNLLGASSQSIASWQNSPVSELLSSFVQLHRGESGNTKRNTKLVQADQTSTSAAADDSFAGQYVVSPYHSTSVVPSNSTENPTSETLVSPTVFEDFAFVDIDYESLLTHDIFHFTPEDMDVQENISPVALQYHGLSQQVSGFSSSSIYKYNALLGAGEKNPFRVGTIFSISSLLMANKATQAGQVKVPLEIYRFPENIRKLVENYFHIYHPWMPMLDRVQIIRHVVRLQENCEPSPDLQLCSVIALLWSVLALVRVDEEPRMASMYSRNAVLALECAPVTTLETIQAMILLGLYFYKAGDWDNAWVLISSSTRMAIDVRLMRPTTKGKDQNPQTARSFDNTNRERTWAAAYSVNTLLAARMGRSPLVRASDWPVPVISDDGWEEWESWRSFDVSEPFVIESGHCLSIFNEFLKVVSLLNTALTCNIDAEDVLHVTADAPVGKSSILFYFQKEIGKWKAELPAHCEPSNLQSPMVAYLHMCSNMVWCAICVRLMHIKDDLDMSRGNVVALRNSEYTSACVSNQRIFDLRSSAMLINYPFMDYFILMSLNFPHMISSNPLASAKHTSRMAQVLESSSKISIPCRITWDLYRIENGMDVIGSDYTEVIESFGNGTQLKQVPHTQSSEPQDQVRTMKTEKVESLTPQLFNNFSLLPKFEYNSRQRFSPYNQSAPKEELDLFMLDTDFAKTDSRLDKFMKNLGFVTGGAESSERNTSAQSLMSLNQVNMQFPEQVNEMSGSSMGAQSEFEHALR